MSVTLTITGNKSILHSYFQPPIYTSDKYECGLLYFSALNSVPNINATNNVFTYGDEEKQLELPFGTYDLYDIGDYLQEKLTDCEIKIKANNNTLKCELYSTKTIHFDKTYNFATLLGFGKVKLEANKWHVSEKPVNILPLSSIRVECDFIKGSYTNGTPSHVIHEFVPAVPPGHRYIEIPKNIIYFPVNKSSLSSVTVKIIDSHGECIDFREENIQLRLHLRKSR
jgi:hypothetical protein